MAWIIWMGPKSNANILIGDKMENIASRSKVTSEQRQVTRPQAQESWGVLLQILQKPCPR